MNKYIKKGDTIFVHAPANSINEMNNEMIAVGVEKLKEIGYSVKFGENVFSDNVSGVVPLQERLNDINNALKNDDISLIMPIYGGYNSNDLLPFLDMELIKKRGITLCGYSDITALLDAINQKTGLKMLHGPSFSCFCDKNIFSETLSIFKKVVEGEKNIEIEPPEFYAEDLWFLKEPGCEREKYRNPGWLVYRQGRATAQVVGGNLETLLVLSGTEYDIQYKGKILFLETEPDVNIRKFMRDLSHLRQMGALNNLEGLMIGSFSNKSLLSNKKNLFDVLNMYVGDYTYPVLSNVSFSHIDPILTLPIGAEITLISEELPRIIIRESLYD